MLKQGKEMTEVYQTIRRQIASSFQKSPENIEIMEKRTVKKSLTFFHSPFST